MGMICHERSRDGIEKSPPPRLPPWRVLTCGPLCTAIGYANKAMRSPLNQVSVVFLALVLGTLPGCMISLEEAAYRGDSQTVRQILDHGGSGGQIDMALIFAASNGQVEMVQLLLERGANVNYTDHRLMSDGYSALHWAATKGRESTVSLLLQHGADRSLKSTDGLTALQLAKQRGHASIVKMLEGEPTRPNRRAGPAAASPPPPPIY